MNKIMQYLKDVKAEMIKVNWPTQKDVTAATTLVICLSIVMAGYIFACDQGLQAVMRLFLGRQ
ncbi:MAG: preprotein translocase subunit SecE [Chitinispirillia bacterium]|nr:preprotein translocase subunit SecE [Chitinispirillia bacterium]MCL2241001.1 preprotein translocase subunit SecE [Chitinispirillia bacterium]